MIYLLIYEQESVVSLCECPDLDRPVLFIVLFQVETELLADILCIDDSINLHSSLVKNGQDRLVNIIVNKYDRLPGRTDEVCRKYICIEHLAVEEDSKCRRQRCSDEEVDFLGMFLQ